MYQFLHMYYIFGPCTTHITDHRQQLLPSYIFLFPLPTFWPYLSFWTELGAGSWTKPDWWKLNRSIGGARRGGCAFWMDENGLLFFILCTFVVWMLVLLIWPYLSFRTELGAGSWTKYNGEFILITTLSLERSDKYNKGRFRQCEEDQKHAGSGGMEEGHVSYIHHEHIYKNSDKYTRTITSLSTSRQNKAYLVSSVLRSWL